MLVDLDRQVALVTGAARGIGRAIATRLGESGAKVVYADVNAQEAAAAAGDDANHAAVALDVALEAGAEAAVGETLRRFGRLDILVNNAGTGLPAEQRVSLEHASATTWREVLDVDLTGVFLMSRAAARPMLAQRAGRIVNVASVLGLVPMRLQSAYVAAKAGVVQVTRSMALEFAARGVLVNAVAPGWTQTEGRRGGLDDPPSEAVGPYSKLLSHIPLNRPANVVEIANAVLFLVDPENSYMTGHTLVVDGGWIAGYARNF
jgi:NAD(P)-dependent dehydrogenase (short-subunit alcohol dehydrogenase family)